MSFKISVPDHYCGHFRKTHSNGQPSTNNIQWLKTINNVQTSIDIVNGGGKYSGGTTGNPHITINNFQSSDTGIYVCRVTNAYGTATIIIKTGSSSPIRHR